LSPFFGQRCFCRNANSRREKAVLSKGKISPKRKKRPRPWGGGGKKSARGKNRFLKEWNRPRGKGGPKTAEFFQGKSRPSRKGGRNPASGLRERGAHKIKSQYKRPIWGGAIVFKPLAGNANFPSKKKGRDFEGSHQKEWSVFFGKKKKKAWVEKKGFPALANGQKGVAGLRPKNKRKRLLGRCFEKKKAVHYRRETNNRPLRGNRRGRGPQRRERRASSTSDGGGGKVSRDEEP